MAIVKVLNKKTGITYVYESQSYRDKTTKQPRSKRKLIGRIDDETGEVVPTRKHKNITTAPGGQVGTPPDDGAGDMSALLEVIREKDESIKALRSEIASLRRERASTAKELRRLAEMLQ